ALKTVLISTQHQPGLDIETLLKPDLHEHVIHPLLPPQFADDRYQLLANPTGAFELGGPHADTGLTGRKIIVDIYGGAARHGGGAFSGKAPSKVARSAAPDERSAGQVESEERGGQGEHQQLPVLCRGLGNRRPRQRGHLVPGLTLWRRYGDRRAGSAFRGWRRPVRFEQARQDVRGF